MDTFEILKHFDSAKPKSGAPNKVRTTCNRALRQNPAGEIT